MRILAALALVFMSAYSAACGGFVLTVENDLFQIRGQSDNNYTHGTEMKWTQACSGTSEWGVVRENWGARSRMYTPDDITRTESPYPYERPWAGVTTAFEEWWVEGSFLGKREAVKYGVETGVLGPSAGCEEMQTDIHRAFGVRLPKGWSNQMPDELALNLYMDRWLRLFEVGDRPRLRWTTDFTYGSTLGTTFACPVKAGLETSFGWNMPSLPTDDVIGPKVVRGESGSGFFGGVVLDASGWYQARNATLSDSFFHDDAERMAKQRDLASWVGEYRAGLVVGWREFSLSYAKALRSREFEGQANAMDWGMIALAFGKTF